MMSNVGKKMVKKERLEISKGARDEAGKERLYR